MLDQKEQRARREEIGAEAGGPWGRDNLETRLFLLSDCRAPLRPLLMWLGHPAWGCARVTPSHPEPRAPEHEAELECWSPAGEPCQKDAHMHAVWVLPDLQGLLAFYYACLFPPSTW